MSFGMCKKKLGVKLGLAQEPKNWGKTGAIPVGNTWIRRTCINNHIIASINTFINNFFNIKIEMSNN